MTKVLPTLASAVALFQHQRRLGERAMSQLTDAELRQALAPGTNSIAVIVKHMSGNMRSRWTDFLHSDGEKPDRNREQEFADDFADRGEIVAAWDRGWDCVFSALADLIESDLQHTVTIRGEPHSVIHAIHRQLDHYGYHVGQIVLMARILAGDRWQHLSIAPGQSAQFNRQMDENWRST
ncbi:MAG: DUF1572 domain-containing protein [Pirellulales bacterium]|nr:DUF1572 domain-containing protein [Pirellulales bacterium]